MALWWMHRWWYGCSRWLCHGYQHDGEPWSITFAIGFALAAVSQLTLIAPWAIGVPLPWSTFTLLRKVAMEVWCRYLTIQLATFSKTIKKGMTIIMTENYNYSTDRSLWRSTFCKVLELWTDANQLGRVLLILPAGQKLYTKKEDCWLLPSYMGILTLSPYAAALSPWRREQTVLRLMMLTKVKIGKGWVLWRYRRSSLLVYCSTSYLWCPWYHFCCVCNILGPLILLSHGMRFVWPSCGTPKNLVTKQVLEITKDMSGVILQEHH